MKHSEVRTIEGLMELVYPYTWGRATMEEVQSIEAYARELLNDQAKRLTEATVAITRQLGRIKELEKELAQYKRDAERYRWIRDNPWPPVLEVDIKLHRNLRWDSEIDAAMAKKQKS